MGVAIVDLQRAGHDAFLPKRNHQHRVNFRGAMRFIIVFYDDFTVIYGFLRGGADEVIVIAVVDLSDANIGQNMLSIGDGNRVSVDIVANNFAHLT